MKLAFAAAGIVGAISALSVLPASAADVVRPVYAPPPAVAAPVLVPAVRGGLYGSVIIGWSNFTPKFLDPDDNHSGDEEGSSANGVFLSGQLGFDFVHGGPLTFGVVADVSANLAGSSNGSECGVDTPYYTSNLKGFASVAAKIGTGGPTSSLYGLVGPAVAFADHTYQDCSPYGTTNRAFTGFTVGIGWEQMTSANTSFKLEGRFYDFQSQTFYKEAASETYGLEPRFFTLGAGFTVHLR